MARSDDVLFPCLDGLTRTAWRESDEMGSVEDCVGPVLSRLAWGSTNDELLALHKKWVNSKRWGVWKWRKRTW